jgi:hypothetical protein
MGHYERIKSLKEGDFKRLTGVRPGTSEKMAEILRAAFAGKKRLGGRPNKLCIEDMLLMALEHLRECRTYFHVGKSYGLSESNAYKGVKWVEGTLVKDGTFSLPGRKALLAGGSEYGFVLVDATETPIERPKKQRNWYSGKKKRHTVKTQVVVDRGTGAVVCTAFAAGRRHGFRLFKESRVRFGAGVEVKADTGYQGIQRLHGNSVLPRKRPKKRALTREDKAFNHSASSGRIERFRVVSDRYRNRRKRFALRFNLISGICNYELQN